jgi:hypothetical protein
VVYGWPKAKRRLYTLGVGPPKNLCWLISCFERPNVQILRDRNGKLQGVIREIAGDEERLYDGTGNAMATYKPNGYTYDNAGKRIGSGNRLAGLIDDEE